MAIVQAILQLHALGWSQRRMASELQIDRETVARYLKLYQNEAKPASAPPRLERLRQQSRRNPASRRGAWGGEGRSVPRAEGA